MVLLFVLLLGSIAAVVPDSSMRDISQSDVYSVVCLFMLLSLTFSISFYGVKKLIEASPKQAIFVGPTHSSSSSAHEVIDF